MGYIYLNDKADEIAILKLIDTIKEVKNKEGYQKQQGKHSIIMGVIFLLVPISLFLVDIFMLNEQLLYLWLIVLAIVVISHIIQIRKYS